MKYLLPLFLCFACSTLFAQEFTKATLIKDIPCLWDSISKKHVNPYSIISKKQFEKEQSELLKAADTLEQDAIMVRLMMLYAKMGDEHFSIYRSQPDFFPLGFYWFHEGVYLAATGPGDTALIGLKLLAVNGMPVEQIAKLMQPLMPTPNVSEMKRRVCNNLNNPVILHGLGIINKRDTALFLLQDDSGKTFTHIVTSSKGRFEVHRTPASRSMLKFEKDDNYWYEVVLPERVLYFAYNRCLADKKLAFGTMYYEMVQKAERSDVKKVIIDLRNNGGGYANIIYQFIDYLAYRQKKDSLKVDVLIGRHTFSAGVVNSVQLRAEMKVRFIGEESGGNLNMFGARDEFKLPNSELTVYYSKKYKEQKKGEQGGVKPDVTIVETKQDWINGIDAALDYSFKN